jgi:hypothetical protein
MSSYRRERERKRGREGEREREREKPFLESVLLYLVANIFFFLS